jgi:hypothetical protein
MEYAWVLLIVWVIIIGVVLSNEDGGRRPR